MNLRIGSVCSGIGGLELGLERAQLGHTVFQVERDAFRRHILQHRWPDVRVRYRDVRTVRKADLPPIELLCGGFPCVDLSTAGKRAGFGTRSAPTRSGLYFECERLLTEIQPPYLVLENVAHTWRSWVPFVRESLYRRGYSSVPFRVCASDVGARHERARIFLIGWRFGVLDPSRLDLSAPDSDGDTVWEQPGREDGPRGPNAAALAPRGAATSPDADLPRLPDRESQRTNLGAEPSEAAERDAGEADELRTPPWQLSPPRPFFLRGIHGFPDGLDAPHWQRAGWTPARLREARIRALGDCVVPPCAERVGRWLKREIERQRE